MLKENWRRQKIVEEKRHKISSPSITFAFHFSSKFSHENFTHMWCYTTESNGKTVFGRTQRYLLMLLWGNSKRLLAAWKYDCAQVPLKTYTTTLKTELNWILVKKNFAAHATHNTQKQVTTQNRRSFSSYKCCIHTYNVQSKSYCTRARALNKQYTNLFRWDKAFRLWWMRWIKWMKWRLYNRRCTKKKLFQRKIFCRMRISSSRRQQRWRQWPIDEVSVYNTIKCIDDNALRFEWITTKHLPYDSSLSVQSLQMKFCVSHSSCSFIWGIFTLTR